MDMFLESLYLNGLMEIFPKLSRTSNITGETVMNMVHEMLMTFMYCMEDTTFDDLVWNYRVQNFGTLSHVISNLLHHCLYLNRTRIIIYLKGKCSQEYCSLM